VPAGVLVLSAANASLWRGALPPQLPRSAVGLARATVRGVSGAVLRVRVEQRTVPPDHPSARAVR